MHTLQQHCRPRSILYRMPTTWYLCWQCESHDTGEKHVPSKGRRSISCRLGRYQVPFPHPKYHSNRKITKRSLLTVVIPWWASLAKGALELLTFYLGLKHVVQVMHHYQSIITTTTKPCAVAQKNQNDTYILQYHIAISSALFITNVQTIADHYKLHA